MKPFCRMAALAMAALLVVALLSGSALAEGAQGSAAPALKAGRWYSPGNAVRLLTVKVSKDALLTASWKGNSQERLYIDLYKDAERKHFLTGLNTYQAASGTQSFVLRKGTYYVSLSDSAKSSHVRFSLCALKDYGNYCPARAITLQRSVKAIQGGHTPLNSFEYDWFKVRLTRKQRITVRCSTNCSFVAFRDTAMKKLDGESTTKKAYRTRDVLGPGTYYLRVNNYGIYNAFATRANTIWWK